MVSIVGTLVLALVASSSRTPSNEDSFRGFDVWELRGREGLLANTARVGSGCAHLAGARRVGNHVELEVRGEPGGLFALGVTGAASRESVVLAGGVLPPGGSARVSVPLGVARIDGLVFGVVGACDEPVPEASGLVTRILVFEPTVECVLYAAIPEKPNGKLWGKFKCMDMFDPQCKVDVWARAVDGEEDKVEVFMECRCGDEEEKASKIVDKTSAAVIELDGPCSRSWDLQLNGDNAAANDTWGEGPGSCDGIQIFGK